MTMNTCRSTYLNVIQSRVTYCRCSIRTIFGNLIHLKQNAFTYDFKKERKMLLEKLPIWIQSQSSVTSIESFLQKEKMTSKEHL